MDTSSENPDRKYSANGTGSNPGSAIQSRHNSVSSLGPQGASASGSAATASAGSQAVLTAGKTQRPDILKIPTFGRREVDLYRLFREVHFSVLSFIPRFVRTEVVRLSLPVKARGPISTDLWTTTLLRRPVLVSD